MTDNVLNVLKLAFLALLYLFFLRVLWVVATEVRANRPNVNPGNASGQPLYADMPSQAPPPVVRSPFTYGPKPKRGKRGVIARLVIIEPRDRRGTAFPVENELTIGRSDGCTIQVLDDTFVSSLHCRIYRDEAGNAIVEDLGSTNGTFLNGDRIHVPKPLHRGDRVQLGSTIVGAQ